MTKEFIPLKGRQLALVEHLEAEIERLQTALVKQTEQHAYPCSPHCAGYLREMAAQAENARLREALKVAHRWVPPGLDHQHIVDVLLGVDVQSAPFFECPDCGKDIAEPDAPHDPTCKRSLQVDTDPKAPRTEDEANEQMDNGRNTGGR